MLLAAGEDAEAPAQNLGDGKIRRSAETLVGRPHRADARESKSAQLFALEVLGEEVPLIFKTCDVKRSYPPRFVGTALKLSILQFQFHRAQDRLTDRLKKLKIGDTCAGTVERNRLLQIAPGERNLFFQTVRDFT